MKNFIKVLSVTLLFVLLIFSAKANVAINKTAPDFSLKGHDGKIYSLKDFKGQYVVLEWFNNGCPFVNKHYDKSYRNMQNLQMVAKEKAKDAQKKLVWLTIASSAPNYQGHIASSEEAQKIIAERNAHMTALLLDGDGKVGKLYSAKTTPHIFIIDPEGILRYQGAIDSIRSVDTADLESAENYVANALKELFAGKPVVKAVTKPYGCSVKYAQ